MEPINLGRCVVPQDEILDDIGNILSMDDKYLNNVVPPFIYLNCVLENKTVNTNVGYFSCSISNFKNIPLD